MKEKRTEKIMIRLTPTELNQIEELSEKKRRNKSDFVRIILQDYLEKINL